MIINADRAWASEIGEIFARYKVFKEGDDVPDLIVWAFLVYERLKGSASFYFPYFQVADDLETLMDWSLEELSMLQDKFLAAAAKRQYAECLDHYKSLEPVFRKHPEYFLKSDLKTEFWWAYKMVKTRAFCTGDGDLVPLADSVNHQDVCTDFMCLTKTFLTNKGPDPAKDYGDFRGEVSDYACPLKQRTYLNRLEKYLSGGGCCEQFAALWELDEALQELESSSDEDEIVNEFQADSSGSSDSEESNIEEEEAEDTYEDPCKYFAIRTSQGGSFPAGQQVFISYGRLNNFDLLVTYGFCLLPNRYDSVYVRVNFI